MKQCISNSIRKLADRTDFEFLKKDYQTEIQSVIGRCKEYAINRDGDNFQVSCPVCKTKMVVPAGCGFFVCKKRHVFSLDTEDGIVEITPDTKILGPDLDKKGRDAHGHQAYETYKPDEKAPIYLALWMTYQNPDLSYRTPTVEDVSTEVWKLKSRVPRIENMYYNYYVEIDTMMGGKPVAKIGSYIRTWPLFMNNMKWFLILRALEGTDWTLKTIHEGDR